MAQVIFFARRRPTQSLEKNGQCQFTVNNNPHIASCLKSMTRIAFIFWLAVLLRAGAATETAVITFNDHTSETYPYLGETRSNVLVEIYGHTVAVARSNIASLQINPASAVPAPEKVTPPAAQAATNDATSISWPSLIQRWLLFSLVVLFLARKVWRFFFEKEDDDDFADYLATLAVAHRWVFPVYLALLTAVAVAEFFQIGNLFFSLSVLFLASSLRRFYCEGDFADYPKAQKIHLAMSLALIWLGWVQGRDNYLSDLSTWLHLRVFAWMMLALATRAFGQFYNHPDFAEHRKALYFFMGGFLIFGILGGIAGCFYWRQTGNNQSPWIYCLAGAICACSPLMAYFYRWNKRVSEQVVGRAIFDIIFSFEAFSEKIKKKKHLPSVLLLRHWRDQGDVEKAWQTAQSHLFREARALPVWLFAMETAVLYRRKPDDALNILRQLCGADEFHYDHRTAVVSQMQGWMAAAGFPFEAAQFKVERPPLQASALTDKVAEKCRAGRFGEAETLLKEVLEQDFLNEPAFTQLVRLYCQDMKNRARAEHLIADARETFSPKLLDYLTGLLDEWMRLPIRSEARRGKFPGWLRRREPEKPASKKIVLVFPSITSRLTPKKSADPLDAYMERVREANGKPPDTNGVHDPVEKLLLERRLGSAVELLKQQADSQPENFDVWLRYAEAHGFHCGNLTTAEKIIRQMERSGNFKKAQMKKVHTRLKKWREKHPNTKTSW
jgi:hypothetical protein